MARDRLAAMRAQQGGQQPYASDNSFPTQASSPEGDYQSRRPNPYAQQDKPSSYEMTQVATPGGFDSNKSPDGFKSPVDDMSAFYAEISSIQDEIKGYNDNVARISNLHAQSLNNMDDIATQRIASQLDDLVADTSARSDTLRRRIKYLQEGQRGRGGRDAQIRQQQTGLVRTKFVEAIQNYQKVEQINRTKYKDRMERQFRIVKPDATQEEVSAVVNGDGNNQIFSQAVTNSNRYGDARQAYNEVQGRHKDIKQIEKTLAELAQLFNDMSILVEQQDDSVNAILTNAEDAEKDVEAGLQHTDKAVDSARAARKKRWICFILSLIILAIIAIVVGVVVSNNVKKN